MAKGVLVFAEAEGGALVSVAMELLGIGRHLADALGEPLQAAVLGHDVQAVAQAAIHHGANLAYMVNSEDLSQY